MSTTPLTDAIEALTSYANSVTGASDTTLSDAVATLANGYGGGGGIDIGDYIDIDTTGMTTVYEAFNGSYTGNNYTDTGVKLFSADNISKDFKIICLGAYLNNSQGTDDKNSRTSIGGMLEVSPYPGIVLRPDPTQTTNSGAIRMPNQTAIPGFVIKRINGTISAEVLAPFSRSTSGQTYALRMGSMSNATTTHDTPITLGCELDGNGSPYRYCGFTFDSIKIVIGS